MKGKLKLLNEVFKNLFYTVTIDYPAGTWPGRKYSQIPIGIRGKHKFDHEKCVGCGGCSMICSSGAISLEDTKDERTVAILLGRCIYCGRCRDICPEKALELTPEFELAYVEDEHKGGLYVKNSVTLAKCAGCGKPIFPSTQMEASKRRLLENIDSSVRDLVAADFEVYRQYCLDCRRKLSFELKTHPRKFY